MLFFSFKTHYMGGQDINKQFFEEEEKFQRNSQLEDEV
jgi:hypothetical protein